MTFGKWENRNAYYSTTADNVTMSKMTFRFATKFERAIENWRKAEQSFAMKKNWKDAYSKILPSHQWLWGSEPSSVGENDVKGSPLIDEQRVGSFNPWLRSSRVEENAIGAATITTFGLSRQQRKKKFLTWREFCIRKSPSNTPSPGHTSGHKPLPCCRIVHKTFKHYFLGQRDKIVHLVSEWLSNVMAAGDHYTENRQHCVSSIYGSR